MIKNIKYPSNVIIVPCAYCNLPFPKRSKKAKGISRLGVRNCEIRPVNCFTCSKTCSRGYLRLSKAIRKIRKMEAKHES